MRKAVNRILIVLWTLNLVGIVMAGEPQIQYRRGSVSRQNLLSSARFHWENNQVLFDPIPETHSVMDTLRILAIRVAFQTDDDPRTTGDGRFDLTPPSGAMIDPPPHDGTYFEHQLAALSNYYHSVSKGKFVLLSSVVDTVYTLNHVMSAYNPGTTEEAVDRGLVELFRDAIELADADSILFSEHDCILIFHAGVGRDYDFGLDTTPSDIPSAFLNLKDLREQLADGDPLYQGIPVENGNHHVKEGIILPETESQEGYEIGLLGTAALMFGFQISLPALWDTETGQSGIGMWGLMDQGSGNYYGLIPTEPCAWSKVFLGWETPIDTLTGDQLEVACSKASHTQKIYRIPINDHEYFLIENRLYDPNRDNQTLGLDASESEVVFQSDYVINPHPANVIIHVDEYDFGLPGSGILIWHVDENVIRDGLAENRVNVNKNHRGVDLEEADGAQDIGESYGITDFGAGSESGVFEDAWFEDNAVHMLANQSHEVLFSPDTYPNSRSYSGANSHIVLSDFSKVDTVMTFSVSNDLIQEGFPREFGLEGGVPYPPLFGDIDGDGETEILVATEGGLIYAWKTDGRPVMDSNAFGYRISVSGDTMTFPVAFFADVGNRIVTAPIFIDRTSQVNAGIVLATEGGALQVLEVENGSVHQTQLHLDEGENINALMRLSDQVVYGTQSGSVVGVGCPEEFIWQQDLQNGPIAGLCQVEENDEIFIGVLTHYGQLFLLDSRGDINRNNPIFSSEGWTCPAAARFRPDLPAWVQPNLSPFSLVTLANQGIGFIVDNANNIRSFGDGFLPENPSDPALGDIDGDGFMEIVVTAGSQIWSFNHNGSLSDYFPIPYFRRDISLSPPLLGDIDGDGHIDIVVTTSNGNVEAYHYDGTLVDGFPLSTGGSAVIPPVLLDLDGDGDVEIGAVSERSVLTVWDLAGRYDSEMVPWGSHLHDVAHTGMNPQRLQETAPSGSWMPTYLVYNYPNPTEGDYTTIRYRLEQPADIRIQIFDLAGELIDELTGPGEGQTENEVIWNLTDVESGTYFCQVQAKGVQGEKVVTIKIAVIK
ncbi:VCBS repeat-containing protein [bacterium]|nr:VCBS repeat-containing protein [bacterium]